MRSLILIVVLVICFSICGCISGTGFEKSTTLCPDSLAIGYMQEKYKADSHAWDGFNVSLTWSFK